MADPEQATETPAEAPAPAKRKRTYDPRKSVYVYHVDSGEKRPDPVPETWLDGRFPQYSETPPKKAGK